MYRAVTKIYVSAHCYVCTFYKSILLNVFSCFHLCCPPPPLPPPLFVPCTCTRRQPSVEPPCISYHCLPVNEEACEFSSYCLHCPGQEGSLSEKKSAQMMSFRGGNAVLSKTSDAVLPKLWTTWLGFCPSLWSHSSNLRSWLDIESELALFPPPPPLLFS